MHEVIRGTMRNRHVFFFFFDGDTKTYDFDVFGADGEFTTDSVLGLADARVHIAASENFGCAGGRAGGVV